MPHDKKIEANSSMFCYFIVVVKVVLFYDSFILEKISQFLLSLLLKFLLVEQANRTCSSLQFNCSFNSSLVETCFRNQTVMESRNDAAAPLGGVRAVAKSLARSERSNSSSCRILWSSAAYDWIFSSWNCSRCLSFSDSDRACAFSCSTLPLRSCNSCALYWLQMLISPMRNAFF